MADDSLPMFIRRFADKHPYAFSYGSAVLISLAALVIVLILPYSRQQPVLLFFEAGVALATWVGGWRAGVVALIGGTIASAYFAHQNIGPPVVFRMVLNLVYTVGIIWVVAKLRFSQEALRQSEKRFSRLNAELEQRVAERTAQLQIANRNLAEREAKIGRLFDANVIGVFISDVEGRISEANDAFLRIVGYEREDLLSGRLRWAQMTPPEWQDRSARALEELAMNGTALPYEKEFFRNDGSRVPVLIGVASLEKGGNKGVAFVLDLTERKLAEQALQQRENELREIVETIPAMTVTIAADGRDAFIGKRFSEYSGLSEEEARGSGWKVTVHPDDLDLYLRKWRPSLVSGDPVEFETRVRRADGEYRWFLARAAPQRDEAGKVIRWYEVLTDIDDRKRTEAVLREREARIRRLVDANLIGVFTWQLDTSNEAGDAVFRDVNDAFLRIVGYDREDLVTGSLGQRILTPPEWQHRTQRAMAEMKLNGSFQPYEKEYIRKDGSRVPVLVGAVQFGETAKEGVAFVIDLTEQKKVEAALRESEEQWKAVFENNPVMYFMVDETGTILSVNPFGAEQLGYTVDELIGRPVTIVFYEADREIVQKNAAACFEQPGQAMSWELRKVRKNGEMIWVRETARATLIRNRRVLLIVCEDITEGKRVAEALREVQTELTHANRVAALGQLTASIAHEVNQPIAGALSSGQAALRWLNKSDLESARRAIERVIRDATRAGDVISGVRTLGKKASSRAESFDINEAIREVIVITRGETVKNGISIETQLTEGLPLVQGVRVRLQQVVLNLVINAIEAVSSVGEGPRELLIKTAKSEADSISVAVQDSGPGLDPQNLERAFEAFYTTKPDGLGLGLSICRSIVEAHGGRLQATANVPHGAIFQFTVRARGDGSGTANA